jgi:tRNA nucleotidyltransferase (CCA-adding enzyme)
MQTSSNFSQLLTSGLDEGKLLLIKSVGQLASELGVNIFLVGGAVRDLILGRSIEDLDLVVEGDAEDIAYMIAKRLSGRVVATSRFSTAKLKVDDLVLDLVTARREYYSKPGALPEVMPGTIKDDLERRDFSINTLAFPIHDMASGEIIDEFGGLRDIGDSLIRVLHDKSFRDDPTRMIRAVRYENRLGFKIESNTHSLLTSHVGMLSKLTEDSEEWQDCC